MSSKIMVNCAHCGKPFDGKKLHLPNIDGICDIVEETPEDRWYNFLHGGS